MRAGTIFAHDQKAYGRWSGTRTRPALTDGGKGLAALIAAAGAGVERGGFEFRN